MDRLVASSRSYQGHLTRAVDQVKVLLRDPMSDQLDGQLELVLAKLQHKWDMVKQKGDEISEAMDVTLPNYETNLSNHLQNLETYYDEVLSVRIPAERMRREWEQAKRDAQAQALAQAAPAPQINIPAPQVTVQVQQPAPPPAAGGPGGAGAAAAIAHRPLKIKPAEMKPFNGRDILEWRPFWDIFDNGIHQQAHISDAEKFAQLRRYLEGDALLTIQGLPVTAANYPTAVALLQDRFDNKDAMIATHMAKLDGLKPAKNNNDPVALRRFQLTVQVHVDSLTALGVAKATYGALLTTRLLQKIPEKFQEKWCDDPARTSIDLDAFLTFLKEKAEALERCSRLKQLEEDSRPPKPEPPPSPSIPATSAFPTVVHPLIGPTTEPSSRFRRTWTCPFGCDSTEHRPSACPLPIAVRKKAIIDKRACHCCFRTGHESKDCTSTKMGPCPKCDGKHHSAVCDKKKKTSPSTKSTSSDPAPSTTATTEPPTAAAPDSVSTPIVLATKTEASSEQDQFGVETVAHATKSSPNSLLMTATILVQGQAGPIKVRCLLDHAAHHTFISKRVADAAKLPSRGQERMAVSGFAGRRSTEDFPIVECQVADRNGSHSVRIRPYVTEKICEFIDQPAESHWKEQLSNDAIGLADDEDPKLIGRVDFLIGADYYWKVVAERRFLLHNGPMAIETLFGWALSGQKVETGVTSTSQSTVMAVSSPDGQQEVFHQLQRMLDIEKLELPPAESVDQPDPVMLKFEETIRHENQRYEVELPYKEPRPKLPSNETAVRKQLLRLVKKLERNNELDRYDDEVNDLIQRGFVEEIGPDVADSSDPVHYLAHHPVYREDKTTSKLRIVFNASGGSPSLNDCLETGPNLNPQIAAVLLRFRLHRVGVTADIEKAFLQIGVAEKDRNALRFLWIDTKTKRIRLFRWRVVVFGVSSSPFLLAATLRHHLKKISRNFPQLAEILMACFYVDDLITGADDPKEAFEMILRAIQILLEAGFPLRKFATNSPELQKRLIELGQDPKETHSLADLTLAKVLGLIWDKSSDCFTYATNQLPDWDQPDRINSMRLLLAAFSRIFDPLGFVAPFIISARILFQELWKRKVTWDQLLPSDIAESWKQWLDELPRLSSVAVPRFYFEGVVSRKDVQLHVFCDASEKAFGAVAYLRSADETGQVNISLVACKSKVAPLKLQTICRLELEAAKVGVKLADYIIKSFGKAVQLHTVYWSDSTVTLDWIRGEPHQWKTFVAHRVQVIHLLSSSDAWRHVPGNQNPADLCSRGCTAQELLQATHWWSGPDWLRKQEENWPGVSEVLSDSQDPDQRSMQEARATQCMVVTTKEEQTTTVIQLDRFSKWSRASRAMAWVRRFIFNSRQSVPESRKSGELTAMEVKTGKMDIVRAVQQEAFLNEILALQHGQRLLRGSKLMELRPYYDKDDRVIRLQRRTELSSVEGEDAVVLPAKHHLNTLLIRNAHEALQHAGTSHTLTEVRRFAWILRGRRAVRELLIKCALCRKQQGPSLQQPIAPLPSNRCSRSLAFDTVGIDFAGPLFVKDEGSQEGCSKTYICLFTCAATRGVHLELVQSQSTHHFLLAFRRFTAMRGLCRFIYSDNAKTFEAADRELRQMWEGLQSEEIRSYFANTGIEWRFICELSPWWGGFYERLVRSVKLPLRKILGQSQLHFDELETVLKEIEATVNSRPLSYVYNARDEPEPLTPSHFIIGKRINLLPPLTNTQDDPDLPENEPTELTRRARYREKLLDGYWKAFKGEYFQQLSYQSSKGPSAAQQVRPGLVVVIHESIVPRHKWRLGIVTEVFPGRDGIVRAVQLRTEKGVLNRSVQRLYSLEIQHEQAEFARPQHQPQQVDDSHGDDEEEPGDEEPEPTEREDEHEPREVIDADTATASRGEHVRTRVGRVVRPPSHLRDYV